jgi:hypothetical protein
MLYFKVKQRILGGAEGDGLLCGKLKTSSQHADTL